MPALIIPALLAVAADPFAREYARAEGTWAVTAMHMNGDEMPAATFKDLTIVLAADKVTARVGGDVLAEGTYRVVGATGKRVEFDLTMSAGPDKGKAFPAVNEWVDADTLRTCLARPGGPRPTGFTPEAGDGRAIFVIKRAKK
jgi:uncharacterized protein (TIGR03067 family)